VEVRPSQAPPAKAQAPQPGPEGKNIRRWLPLVLAGAGLAGVIVVVVLAVGVTDVRVGQERHTGQKRTEAPSPPSGQAQQTVAAGWQADSKQARQPPPAPPPPPEESGQQGWRADRKGPAAGSPLQKAQAKTGWQADASSAANQQQGSQAPAKSGWQPGATEKKLMEAAKQYLAEGLAAAKTGNFQLASLKFQAAVKLFPNDASAWNNLGLALRKLGKLEQAIKAYQSAIKAKPDFALAYKNLGVALEKRGSLQQAAQAYLRYAQLDPAAADAASVKKRAEILLASRKQKAGQR
jgi:tetratricopeptide (TPR) repeat protein